MLCNMDIKGLLFSTGPHDGGLANNSASQGENEEDIDIVGSNETKAQDRSAVSSNEDAATGNSADGTVRFYGPAQFTDADVLAFMTSEGGAVKAEPPASPVAAPVKTEDEKENGDDINVLKEKLKKLEESNKCSKCTVRNTAF